MLDADQHLAVARCRRLGEVDQFENVVRRAEASELYRTHSASPLLPQRETIGRAVLFAIGRLAGVDVGEEEEPLGWPRSADDDATSSAGRVQRARQTPRARMPCLRFPSRLPLPP